MRSEMTLKAVASYTVKVGFSPLKHPFPVSLFRTCLCADAAKKKNKKIQVQSGARRHFIAVIFKDDNFRWTSVQKVGFF